MRIRVNQLKPNMMIGEDIFSENGLLILPKGFSISDVNQVVHLLTNNNIKKVKVISLDERDLIEHKEEPIFLDRNEIKEQEIKVFVEEFGNIVKNFQEEIEQSLLGNTEKNNLLQIVSDNLSSTNNKNTNIFQLLQKFKDKDDVTFLHCNSVSLISYTIGKWVDLSPSELEDISIAGLLADVGKFAVPQEILQKKGPLTFEEFEIIKSHVEKSVEVIENYGFNENILNAVRFHHEKVDGSGYPYGLKHEQIPLLARIISIADMFVALTSKRPYRDKMTPFQAVRILEVEYMQKLDIVVLSEFTKRIAKRYIGNGVILSDNREGEILFINNLAPLRPIIQFKSGELLDLSNEKNSDIKIIEFL